MCFPIPAMLGTALQVTKHEFTSTHIRSLLGKGLNTGKLNEEEIKEVCGSGLAHLERQAPEFKATRLGM